MNVNWDRMDDRRKMLENQEKETQMRKRKNHLFSGKLGVDVKRNGVC